MLITPRTSRMHQPGYIYCFYVEETNYYKIGVIRKQPHEYLKAERLKYLSSKQSLHQLVMLHSVPVNDIWESEKYLHQFQEYKVGDCDFEFDPETLNQVINTMEYCKNHSHSTYDQNRRLSPSMSLSPKIGTIVAAVYYMCVLSGYQLKNKTYQDCLNDNANICKQSSN